MGVEMVVDRVVGVKGQADEETGVEICTRRGNATTQLILKIANQR